MSMEKINVFNSPQHSINKTINSKFLLDIYKRFDDKLSVIGESLTLDVVGGAVICSYGFRDSTIDIDACYKCNSNVYSIIEDLSTELHLPSGFINDDVSEYMSDSGEFIDFYKGNMLLVRHATKEYLFAMKCFSCRCSGSSDIKDLMKLCEDLKINSIEKANSIISKFYNIEMISILYCDVLEDIFNGTAEYYF